DQNVAGGRPGGERRALALSAIDQASRRTSSPPVQLTRTNEVSGRHNIHAGSGGCGVGGRGGDRRPDDRDLPGLTVITRRGALVRARRGGGMWAWFRGRSEREGAVGEATAGRGLRLHDPCFYGKSNAR